MDPTLVDYATNASEAIQLLQATFALSDRCVTDLSESIDAQDWDRLEDLWQQLEADLRGQLSSSRQTAVYLLASSSFDNLIAHWRFGQVDELTKLDEATIQTWTRELDASGEQLTLDVADAESSPKLWKRVALYGFYILAMAFGMLMFVIVSTGGREPYEVWMGAIAGGTFAIWGGYRLVRHTAASDESVEEDWDDMLNQL